MTNPEKLINEIERIRARNNTSWMNLVRLAWKMAPDEARKISQEIADNDASILGLSKEMAAPSKKAVLIPGGGILHTFAVREAQALGLEAIVTDIDPNCPCSKMPGVEFYEIDCYDTDSHRDLATKLKSRLVGAFCGGADTHVQVAAAAEVIGSTWVSVETAMKCKNKLHGHWALLDADVPTAQGATKAPAIFKPTYGSGSRGVKRQLTGDLIAPGPGHWEEILEGPEQSVEILLREDGYDAINIVDRHFAWVNDQPLEWGHTNPSALGDGVQDELFELCFRAAMAVGANVGFFKSDTILTKDGPKVLECTPRLSGGWDSQLSTPRSSGRNLLRYGLQLACGLPLDESLLKSTKSGSVKVIHRPELCAEHFFRKHRKSLNAGKFKK